MKRIMARETILAYPDFNKPFEIHTDVSATQLGACIAQDSEPIAFYQVLHKQDSQQLKENCCLSWKL